jgi:hypothetical protein
MFNFLKNTIETISWLQIAVSPFLIGLGFGVFFYFKYPTKSGLIIGLIFTLLGLLIGIVWASKIKKTKGTTAFMSQLMATPELDHKKTPSDNN